MSAVAAQADRSRRITSALMTSLTALCTLLAVGALFIILAYIALLGICSLNFKFLIDSPRPVGEGGGFGNAFARRAPEIKVAARMSQDQVAL